MTDVPAEHFTERMEPDRAHPRTFWEHVERYRFARPIVRGRRVLDVASGEGYGAAAMARAGASSVIGVDLSADACDRARTRYAVDARVGDAMAIPLPDRSIDVVVSFETIEHVESPAAFLDETVRVLDDGGTLVVSTPNRPVYNAGSSPNPFHRVELDEAEFRDLLGSRFREVRLFTQFPRTAAWWSPRSLAAERSPWLRIKGYWRASTWLCPALRPGLSDADRAAVVDLIQEDDAWPSTLVNPFRVRPIAPGSREQPYLLVAVATGPRRG